MLTLSAIGAVAGAFVLDQIGAPTKLGDLYCYATITTHGLVYEDACRIMDLHGFVTMGHTFTPSGSLTVLTQAIGLVAEARVG